MNKEPYRRVRIDGILGVRDRIDGVRYARELPASGVAGAVTSVVGVAPRTPFTGT